MKHWITLCCCMLTLFALSAQTPDSSTTIKGCPRSDGERIIVELRLPDTSFRDLSLPMEQRVEILLRQLTLKEKLAMMEHQNPAIERLGIPAYSWWNEALHGVARNGYATVYPQPIGLAATFDVPAVKKMFSWIAVEGRWKFEEAQRDKEYGDYKGISFFTPNINIFRDPRWGRGMETYGEDPYLTAQMGKACVQGLQGDDPTYFLTLACAKHFAVHSGPESIRHSFDVSVTPRDLWTTYLPAFETLVKEANVQQVMCGYNRLDGEPCCTNQHLLVKILKEQWGYEGLFVTDCWALNDAWERDTVIPRHETYPTAADAATAAFGSVIDLECGSGLPALKEAVERGYLDKGIIDEHVRKILMTRMRLGLFSEGEMYRWKGGKDVEVEPLDYDYLSYRMACESMVLLQNKNNILPLDPAKYKRIAVVGPNAANDTMMWGNYNGTPYHTVTILKGIRDYAKKHHGPSVYYDMACHHVDGLYKLPANFDRQIAKCDLIIFVGGLSPMLEGEQLDVEVDGFHGGDRTSIELPRIQNGMLRKLKKTGKPVILVLNTGSAVALDWEDENLDGILCAWYPGQEGGTAVADVLFGKYNPSGRLPVTFYSAHNELPPFDSYDMHGRTYRFMTEKPLYPFGHGLSYTTFSYSDCDFKVDDRTVSCIVTNTGQRLGSEVVQVYLRNPQDPEGPVKTLVGFKRVTLQPSQSIQLSFPIEERFFQSFNDKDQTFEFRPGTFYIMVGDQMLEVHI
ncbi:MAG: glycoside hydrolase family 3 C-terminal domain-containing protein [Bacteroidales bacterium]|nr:glycoside hydrolase family 3 C-terminal domain-containing protein [Bacteroidales bacterium]